VPDRTLFCDDGFYSNKFYRFIFTILSASRFCAIVIFEELQHQAARQNGRVNYEKLIKLADFILIKIIDIGNCG
jgi:hypothetical protein